MNYNCNDEETGYPDFEYRPLKPEALAQDPESSTDDGPVLRQAEGPPESDYARFQPIAAPAQPEDAPVCGVPFRPEEMPVSGMPFQPAEMPVSGVPYQPAAAPAPMAPYQPGASPIPGMQFQPAAAAAPMAPPVPHPLQAPDGADPYAFRQAAPMDAPHDAAGDRQGGTEWSLRRRGDARPDEWREPSYSEPSYSEPHDSTYAMYTPGISVNPPYSRKRVSEAEPEHKERQRSGRLGRFARAACLVMLCVSLSAAAAYAGVSYRISRGDFGVVNQVVLGGASSAAQQGDGYFTSAAADGGMAPQDIYEMALTQVVGIITDVPNAGSFGSMDAMGSSTISGSGFIISADGYILTNFHVIEQAQQSALPLTAVLHDGTVFDARIVGYDKANDVALLKIEATGLNPAILSNSNNIRVGQSVYAVGNPFGDLVYTMTDGIVSALDRIVTVDSKAISTFQFSAAVNSGNSGGPVYDKDGEVIGIVTAKLMRGSVEGIGFAIPINDAIEIASGLIEHGYIAGRPLIGIVAQTANSGHAEYFGWVVGAYIRSVNPGSAAEKAGLMVGDIITAIGGSEVDSMESLRTALRKYRAGDTTTLTAWRSGEYVEVAITFDEDLAAGQPEQQQQAPPQQQIPPQQQLPDQEQDQDYWWNPWWRQQLPQQGLPDQEQGQDQWWRLVPPEGLPDQEQGEDQWRRQQSPDQDSPVQEQGEDQRQEETPPPQAGD